MRAMKDSGLLWIETIPDNWETYSIRHLFSFGKGLPITKDDLKESGIPVVSYGQVHSKANKGTGLCQSLIRFVDESYRDSHPESLTKIGDFIFADTSEDVAGCGNCAFVDRDTTLFAGYHTIILRSKNQTSNKYLAYLFLTDAWRKQIRERVAGIKVFSVSQKILRETTIIVPPATEQRRIVEFLDDKCARIDAVMEQTRASIEEYKKLKQSIITEAVTEGIRPNRPMKDSGIDWIGQIPAEWVVRPLKAYIDILPGYAFSSEDFNSERGVRLLRGINVSPNQIRWNETVFWDKPITKQLEQFMLCEKDLVIGLDRPWISEGTRVAFIKKEDLPCLLLQRVCRIRTKKEMDIRFVYHALAGKAFEDALSTDTTGVSVPHISTKLIQQFIMAVPSLKEQQEICDYLEMKGKGIDALIAQKEQLLFELESYKKSLIYEYVTGKKEVGNAI